jgi:hypothetical protein
MDDDLSEQEFTIVELIQLELCSVEAIIETVPDCSQVFYEARQRLVSLIARLRDGQLQLEYAEVELEQIREIQAKWLRENEIPPN